MGIWQAWRMAIKSILSNKVRSFLTMLGVIIGVGSVITAVAFAQGSTKSITDSIQSMGSNLIQIMITGRGSNRNVSYEDLKSFAEANPDDIAGVAPSVSSTVTVKVGTVSLITTTLMGTTPDYELIKDSHVSSGRYILDVDVTYRQKIALIGSYVANELFPDSDPIGQKIKVNGNVLTVVGVLTEQNGSQEQTEDDYIIIPVSTAQRMLRNGNIRTFMVQSASAEKTADVMTALKAFLLKIYGSENAFRVFNQADLLSTLSTVTDTLMLVLGGIAAISLLVGGIGIMNIMLVSVTERTREIGIRKAIGAKRRSILTQFLIEAIVVTGLGGLTGIVLGLAAIRFVIGGLGLVPAVYSLPWVVISFSISLATGILFGMFPAIKASRLNPIEALRFE
jgi:putative ABC transport system permease protein